MCWRACNVAWQEFAEDLNDQYQDRDLSVDFSQIDDELEAMINDPDITTELSGAGLGEMPNISPPVSSLHEPIPAVKKGAGSQENEKSQLLAFMG